MWYRCHVTDTCHLKTIGLKSTDSCFSSGSRSFYKYVNVLKAGFKSMDMAQNILVIKTISGMAMAVAASIDELDFPQIVGSIAGDDTVMCAVRTVEDTYDIMDEIEKL